FSAPNHIGEWGDLVVNHSVDPVSAEFRYGRHMTVPAAPVRAPILRTLRVGLHVMFAVLLGLGLVRAFADDATSCLPMHHRLIITIVVTVLALVCVLGTSQEYRLYRRAAAAVGQKSPMSKLALR